MKHLNQIVMTATYRIALGFLFLFSNHLIAQDVKELRPNHIIPLDFSPEKAAMFNSEESWAKCEEVWKIWNKEDRDYDSATEEELVILANCDEMKETIWASVGDGCSWYCGGGPSKISSSSSLSSQGKNSYEAVNAHDFSYKTAWVEGVKGNGIGEYLFYHFEHGNPRITDIFIANGYVKSKKAWRDNGRVKKLKLYHDNKPIAILHLEDQLAEQHFKFDPLSFGTNSSLKFEILEVYPGEKYEDVAISEIYFDGLDVHCLARGSMIKMADQTSKTIESLEIGDIVTSFNSLTSTYEPAKVLELAQADHCQLVELHFSNGSSLTCTQDHPILSEMGHFLSIMPEKTMYDYDLSMVGLLEQGARIRSLDKILVVDAIKLIHQPQTTYTIVSLSKNQSFVANGVVVGSEPTKKPSH